MQEQDQVPHNIQIFFNAALVTKALCPIGISEEQFIKYCIPFLSQHVEVTSLQISKPFSVICMLPLAIKTALSSFTICGDGKARKAIDSTDMVGLAYYIMESTSLKALALERLAMRPCGVQVLFEALIENRSITDLRLADNAYYAGFNSENYDMPIKECIRYLQSKPRLVALDIGNFWNGPNFEGHVKALCKSLNDITTLISLNLKNSHLDSFGLGAILSMLESNSTLMEVNLDEDRVAILAPSFVESIKIEMTRIEINNLLDTRRKQKYRREIIEALGNINNQFTNEQGVSSIIFGYADCTKPKHEMTKSAVSNNMLFSYKKYTVATVIGIGSVVVGACLYWTQQYRDRMR